VPITFPPPEHSHTWAELLTLVGAVRRIAYDITLEAGDALRKIRDAFADHDEMNRTTATRPHATTARSFEYEGWRCRPAVPCSRPGGMTFPIRKGGARCT
jgi:hypothetical protein